MDGLPTSRQTACGNTGDRDGSDLIQLYVRPRTTVIDRPNKELRAFGKVHLTPGQSDTVRLSIKPRDLNYFDVDTKAFVAPTGDYDILVAANASDIRQTITINLARTK